MTRATVGPVIMMPEKDRTKTCSHSVCDSSGWHYHKCRLAPVCYQDTAYPDDEDWANDPRRGKTIRSYYCRRHNPLTVAEKRRAEEEKRRAEYRARRAEEDRVARLRELTKDAIDTLRDIVTLNGWSADLFERARGILEELDNTKED